MVFNMLSQTYELTFNTATPVSCIKFTIIGPSIPTAIVADKPIIITTIFLRYGDYAGLF